jgi:hypothetical protein
MWLSRYLFALTVVALCTLAEAQKQDKAGHRRSTKVPHFSTDPVKAYAIDERMKQLGARNSTRKNSPGLRRLRRFP